MYTLSSVKNGKGDSSSKCADKIAFFRDCDLTSAVGIEQDVDRGLVDEDFSSDVGRPLQGRLHLALPDADGNRAADLDL